MAVILLVCMAMAIACVYVLCEAIIALVCWAPVLVVGILATAASSALGADTALTFALAACASLIVQFFTRPARAWR